MNIQQRIHTLPTSLQRIIYYYSLPSLKHQNPIVYDHIHHNIQPHSDNSFLHNLSHWIVLHSEYQNISETSISLVTYIFRFLNMYQLYFPHMYLKPTWRQVVETKIDYIIDEAYDIIDQTQIKIHDIAYRTRTQQKKIQQLQRKIILWKRLLKEIFETQHFYECLS